MPDSHHFEAHRTLMSPQDSRNVLRNPPPGVQFNFDFAKSYPVAMAMLKEDSRLQKLRFDLVPKKLVAELIGYFIHVHVFSFKSYRAEILAQFFLPSISYQAVISVIISR